MKKSAILGLVTIAVAIAVIISIYANSSSYGTFSDARKSESVLRVVGALDKQKELYYDAAKDPNYFTFYVKDKKGEDCKVVYGNTEPQDFEKSEQIVLTGQMVGNEFHASAILMKCPSKYTKDKLDDKTFESKTSSL
jgi:cytochrome c-type biogenesis protein CcmE